MNLPACMQHNCSVKQEPIVDSPDKDVVHCGRPHLLCMHTLQTVSSASSHHVIVTNVCMSQRIGNHVLAISRVLIYVSFSNMHHATDSSNGNSNHVRHIVNARLAFALCPCKERPLPELIALPVKVLVKAQSSKQSSADASASNIQLSRQADKQNIKT